MITCKISYELCELFKCGKKEDEMQMSWEGKNKEENRGQKKVGMEKKMRKREKS